MQTANLQLNFKRVAQKRAIRQRFWATCFSSADRAGLMPDALAIELALHARADYFFTRLRNRNA
jgi:hypothetical protein